MTLIAPWFQLGYVIPHLYTDMDAYQFYKIAPDGVMLVTTQLDLGAYSLEAVEEELPTFWERVDVLAKKRVDVISLSGVPIASVLGRTRVLELLDGVRERTGIRADTDIEAHIAALKAFGASKIALATRWPDRVADALTRYLAEAGIEVLACRSQGRELDANKQADAMQDHHLALELGRQALEAAPEAEALMLPGGLWFAVHAAPQLESEFDVPVTLNISATLWASLQGQGELPASGDPKWGRLVGSL